MAGRRRLACGDFRLLAISVSYLAINSFRHHGKLSVPVVAALGFLAIIGGGLICSPNCGLNCAHRNAGTVLSLFGVALLIVAIVEEENLVLDEKRRIALCRSGHIRLRTRKRKANRAERHSGAPCPRTNELIVLRDSP